MLDSWSVALGILATLLVTWLLRIRPRKSKRSVNTQRKLLPRTDDHDRFHGDIQKQQMAPEDLEIGPILGSGTFGEVFRGTEHLHDTHRSPTLLHRDAFHEVKGAFIGGLIRAHRTIWRLGWSKSITILCKSQKGRFLDVYEMCSARSLTLREPRLAVRGLPTKQRLASVQGDGRAPMLQ